jgi:hypothetical protein
MPAPSVSGRTALTGTITAVKSGSQSATVAIASSGVSGQQIQVSGTVTINEFVGGRFTFTSTENFSSKLLCFHASQRSTTSNAFETTGNNGVTLRAVDTSDRVRVFQIGGRDKRNFLGVTAPTFATSFAIDVTDSTQAVSTDSGFDPAIISYVELRGLPTITSANSLNFGNFFSIPITGVLLVNGESGTPGSFQTFSNYLTETGTTFLVLASNPADDVFLFSAPLKVGNNSTDTYFLSSASVAIMPDNEALLTKRCYVSSPELRLDLKSTDTCIIDFGTLKSSGIYKINSLNNNGTQTLSGLITDLIEGSTGFEVNDQAVFRQSGMLDGASRSFVSCTFSETSSTNGALHLKPTTTLTDCTFTDNTTGAAIYIDDADTYDLAPHTFTGNTINVRIDGVAATLELSAAQFSAYNTDPDNFPIATINGGSVTVTGPSVTTVFSGFPTANNANGVAPAPVIGFYDAAFAYIDGLDTGDTEYSAGTFTVLLSDYAGVAYVVGDAIGWVRTDFIPVDASNPPGAVSLAAAFREIVDEEGDALVGLGTTEGKAKLTYDQANTRFEVAAGAITFSDTLDKKEDLTSDLLGLANFNTSVVRGIQFISNKYGNEILLPSPLTISANATALTSPILTNFLVIRSGDPTADPFEHGLASDAVGLDTRPEIRVNSTKFIAATEGGGGGLDAAGVRSAIGLASANLDTQLSTIDTVVDAILVDTAEIGAAGAGLTDAGGTGDHLSAIPTIANVTTVGTVTNAVTTTTPPLDATETQAAAAAALNAYDPPTRAELTSDIGTVTTAIADVPTVAEFEARTLPSADYFVVGDYTSSLPQNFAALAITEAGLVTATNGGGSGGGEIDLGLTGFITLMRSDLAYRRLAAEAQGIPSLADELALIRTQVWSSVEVRTAWNAALGTEGITAPSTGEIALWNGYLTATGFDGISFGTGGVVS